MSTKKRTRHSSSTVLAEYLGGPGCDFLPTEVPTLRDVLRKGLLIREAKMLEDGGDRKNYPVRPMIEELVSNIHDQWKKSNVKFTPPVVTNSKSLVNRLLNVWEKVTAIAQKKETKPKLVNSYTEIFWPRNEFQEPIRNENGITESESLCDIFSNLNISSTVSLDKMKKIYFDESNWSRAEAGFQNA